MSRPSKALVVFFAPGLEGDNDIGCTLGPDDRVTMNCAKQTPAPPPRTPIDPDET